MKVAASPRSRAQVAAVLAFVISHTMFLAAQDDETGRCPKVVFKLQVTSHSAPLIPHPSYSSLITNFRVQGSGFRAVVQRIKI